MHLQLDRLRTQIIICFMLMMGRMDMEMIMMLEHINIMNREISGLLIGFNIERIFLIFYEGNYL